MAESIIQKFGPFKKLVLNDPSPNMLEHAKYRMRYNEEVKFENHYVEELPFEKNSFTTVLCLNSFHYYVDQEKALKNIKKVLKPGGTFYLLDWNRTGRMKITAAIINWLSPEHINTRSLDEMTELLHKHGFKIQKKKEWSFRWWNFFFLKCKNK